MDDASVFATLATPEPAAPEAPAAEETTPEIAAPDQEVEESSPETAETAEGTAVEDAGEDKPVDARTNPAAVRAALKALRDSNPAMAPIARQLNDAFGRYNAYKQVFPKVADAQNARALLDAVGGSDGFASLQEQIKAISATDAKLYSGDASVIDDILEDMKAEGKQEAFGKLGPRFLEKLRETNEKAYFDTMKPHFYQGLEAVGLQNVLGTIAQALSGEQPDLAGARQILQNVNKWFEDLKGSVDSMSKQNLDPERQAFEQERQKFQTERQQAFNTEVAGQCDTHNNQTLLNALKQYTKLPAFKNFSAQTWQDIGSGVKQQLLSELTQDKAYQAQMDAFFSQKSPDKGKIVAFHQQKVDAMAARIVKQLLDRRYPGYSATAKPAAKKAAPAGKPQTNPQTGKVQFQYVKSQPAWNDINWDSDPQKHAYVTGRAQLKDGRYVSWNPKDRK